ncbi:hypothetical protein C5167_031162 [Papaver somniferum]|nr:hypothetical protein C5167_031162 [Papaver somniferum]
METHPSEEETEGKIIFQAVDKRACKLKLGDFKGASLDTEFAMRDGKDNVKILFVQGQAYMAFNDVTMLWIPDISSINKYNRTLPPLNSFQNPTSSATLSVN